MYDINNIYQMLNWENPAKIQLEGIRLAKEVSDLSLLIQPPAPPSVWGHCANILYEKSDAQLEPYLDDLLEWLQDLNLPGACKILDRLKTFSPEKLRVPLENAVVKSKTMSRDDGLRWLDYLSELLDNSRISAILSPEIQAILKKHYHNWGYWYNE